MAQVASQYTTRSYQPDDEGSVLELLRLSLGESETLQRTPALWRWKHLISPFGPSYIRLACDREGRLAGMRAFMRWQLQASDREILAVRAVDTATHPEHQRRGVFSTLTGEVVADVQRDGVDLIFNTPNQYSLPGYLKLGWHYVGKVHPQIKVLNYPNFVLGMVRQKLSKSSLQFPSTNFFSADPTPISDLLDRRIELKTLIQKDRQLSNGASVIATQRSCEYLSWRYAEHPAIQYWTVFVEDDGKLQASAIIRTNTRFGLKEVVLCELLLSEAEENSCQRLIDQLCSLLRADYIVAYFPQGSLHRYLLNRCNFRAVPWQGMDFTCRVLSDNIPHDPQMLENWSVTRGDLELF